MVERLDTLLGIIIDELFKHIGEHEIRRRVDVFIRRNTGEGWEPDELDELFEEVKDILGG